MKVISLAFMLFIAPSRVIVVTMAFLYLSSMVFLVLFVSFSLFTLFHGKSNEMAVFQQFASFLGGVLLLISVFGAVALIVVLYMILFFSLRLEGFAGVMTGLIPSITLSAASWYIKTRLLANVLKTTISHEQSELATTVGDVSDGETDSKEDQKILFT